MSEIAALPKNGLKAASTFSGCGGSSLGYKMAGFELLWASEFIPSAQETYRANHPATILDTRDIREVTVQDVLDAIKMQPGELDLFDGSPPCASFSTAGIREDGWGRVKKYSDSKQRTDDLFFEYVRLVKGIQPKVFVAENVKGLTMGAAVDILGTDQLDMFEAQDDTIYHSLMDAGYIVRYQILNARDLGVPQSRQRVIFIGIRRDLANRYGILPSFPRRLPYGYTMRDAMPWLDGAEPNPFPVEPETSLAGYATGAEWVMLKPGEQSEKYFSLVRCDPDKAVPTICASHGSKGIACTCHPHEQRKFSIGELKRLSGFPDDFILQGTFSQQWERLGRAVPPVMMAAVAATIRDEMFAKITPHETAP